MAIAMMMPGFVFGAIIPSRSSKNSLIFTFPLSHQDKVTINICDFSGRSIAAIANDTYEKGTHELSWTTGNIPRGIYLVRMNTSKGNIVKRFSLVR